MAQTVIDKNRHRIVGACLIYNPARQFLIIKRHQNLKVYPSLWTVPGGGMDRTDYESLPQSSPDGWESPLEAALRREILEEAGIKVGNIEYLSHFTFIRPDNIPVFGIRFAAPYASGDVVLDPKDSTEFAWISADKAGEYDLLGRIADEMREFDEKLRTRE